MIYRFANKNYAFTLTKHRIHFFESISNKTQKVNFDNVLGYISDHIGNDLIALIAIENDCIISSCFACIYNILPTPNCPNGVCAELLNVYTVKNYRNKGIASEIVDTLISKLYNLGVTKIRLTSTDKSQYLYLKKGFKFNHQYMDLTLTE